MTPHRQSQSTKRLPHTPALDSARRGFTLVELMVVIVIIAALVGLIMPAVMNAMVTARDAEVRTEIDQLGTAISSFKTEFGGIAPPSSIRLYEQKKSDGGWIDAKSNAAIRRIWPQFNFELDRDLDGNGSFDPDPDGDSVDGILLSGEECLVFFLGGVKNSGALVGFSKNPGNPLDPNSGNRVGPFFEFDPARVVDGNVYSVYLDPIPSQTNPYVYFNSNNGHGYKSTDSLRSNVYAQPGGTTAYNPKSHQIISPGADGKYGDASVVVTDLRYPGGVYDPDTESTVGEEERDNITNFSSGRLVP